MISMNEDVNRKHARWFNRAFVRWQAADGSRKTIEDFAAYLGYKQPRVSHYLSGRYIPPYQVELNICQKLNDYEGMRILGYPVPMDHSSLPADFRRRLEAAEEEVNRTLAERGLTGEMPEAETVTIEIFGKWGFRYTSTSKQDEASTK